LCLSNLMGTALNTDFYLEPECAIVGSNFNVVTDATASNGEYVTIQNDNTSTGAAPNSTDDRVRFTIDVSVAGDYNIYGRVIAPNSNDDSFWVRVNNGSWIRWNNIGPFTSWNWELADGSGYSLSVGTNTIDFAYREDGALLDKIYVTLNGSAPSGEGNSAINCLLTEDCTNGIDDDGDGLVDIHDVDCGILCPLGGLTLERWQGISGDELVSLTSNAAYPNDPTDSLSITSFNGPQNIGNNYGTRVRGYISPAQTGTYTFNITGDDECELYLSSNTSPTNKVLIASISEWTNIAEHTKYTTQTSNEITLTTGEHYFVEFLHKENVGGDHFQVYWKTPSNNTWTIIPGTYLRPVYCLENCLSCVEYCDDLVDNDGDDDVDCDDSDCAKPTIANVTSTDPDNCPDLDNGQIVVLPLDSDFEYSIDSGTTYQTSNTFAGLLPGDYSIRVKNTLSGCHIDYVDNPINLKDTNCMENCEDGIDNDGNGLVDYQDASCASSGPRIKRQGFGVSAGSVEPTWLCAQQEYVFEIENTSSNFISYSWNFSTYTNTPSADGIGPHTVQFDTPTDTVPVIAEVILIADNSFGYEVRDTFLLHIRPQPQITIVHTIPPSTCGGNDGVLAVEVVKDTSTCVQISIDGGVTWGMDDQLAFANLGIGDYEVMIRYCGEICEVNNGTATLPASVSYTLVEDEFLDNCPGAVFQNSVRVNDTIVGETDIIFRISEIPTNGTVTINNVGEFEYTPTSAVCGVDSFFYQVCDLSETCCATAKARMMFTDKVAPTLTNVPIDVTISCDEEIPVPELVGAFDNCPSVSINVEEVSTKGEDGCSQHHYTLKRTWIAADACGHEVRDSQIIEVEDLTAPQIFRIYTLPNGKKMVAGTMENVNQNWKTIKFPISFETTPIVFAQVTSSTDPTPVVVQIKDIRNANFKLRLKEALINDGIHAREKVSWIALEAGIQTQLYELNAVTINTDQLWAADAFSSSFNNVPAFFAGLQTTQEEDPAIVRYRNLSKQGVEVSIEEETSSNTDSTHQQERVGYLALDNDRVLVDRNGKPLGEVGRVAVNQDPQTIKTKLSYHNPVVITSGLPNREIDPSTARLTRIDQVAPDSFRIQLVAWDHENGSSDVEDISYLVIEGSIPLDASDICDTGSDGLEIGVDYVAIDNCDPSVTIQYKESQVVHGTQIQTVRTWLVEDECGNPNGYSQVVICEGIQLRLRALLQGAMVGNDQFGDGMMRDDLREKGLLPTLEPYSDRTDYTHVGYGGGEECEVDLLAESGPDAIVDWVFIEIRDRDNFEEVLGTCSGLIQCDGDVVTEHGDTLLNLYNMPPGDYYVALRHRNHIPIVSDRPYHFSLTNIPFVDFTKSSTHSKGHRPRVKVDNTQAIWSGDLNGDGEVIFQGAGNDVFPIFIEVLLDGGNEDNLSNYISEGYVDSDFNMDGKVIYQGPANDKAALLWHTILEHPENDLKLSNFVVSTKKTTDNTVYLSCQENNTQSPCNFDGDEVLNEDDPDDDDDGVADGADRDPYNSNSDSDLDGISDFAETGEDGVYHAGTDSDPLSPCDPNPNSAACLGMDKLDKDADGCFPNYPHNHRQFDGDDSNACFPIPTTQDCNCTDGDQDGYIEVCHGKVGEEIKGKTLRVRVIDWLARKRLGDICGPCGE